MRMRGAKNNNNNKAAIAEHAESIQGGDKQQHAWQPKHSAEQRV